MNKYEQHLTNKRKAVNTWAYLPQLTSSVAVDRLCGACALAAIIALGRCDHIDYLRDIFIPRWRSWSFCSMNGSGLFVEHSSPICGHIPGGEHE